MERDSGIIRSIRNEGLIIGFAGAAFASALGVELAQGADPVVFSHETGKQIAEYASAVSFLGFGLGVTMEFLDRLIPIKTNK